MTARLRIATALAVPALLAGGVATPAHGQAEPVDHGGASFGGPGLATPAVGGLLRGKVRWRNTLPGASAARIERLDEATGAWTTIARAPVASDGWFLATWRADRIGASTVRAVADDGRAEASSAESGPTARVSVYRGVRATWYGPGFFGRRLACGGRLSRSTLGVAHRRLPCGTKVELFHRGRSLVVPVVDRGPFANRAHYDLTAATAQALGFKGTGRIGVAPRPAAVARKRGKRKRS
jgi:rare lipoprotein A